MEHSHGLRWPKETSRRRSTTGYLEAGPVRKRPRRSARRPALLSDASGRGPRYARRSGAGCASRRCRSSRGRAVTAPLLNDSRRIGAIQEGFLYVRNAGVYGPSGPVLAERQACSTGRTLEGSRFGAGPSYSGGLEIAWSHVREPLDFDDVIEGSVTGLDSHRRLACRGLPCLGVNSVPPDGDPKSEHA
jgi:hypothetical protein